MSTSQPKSEQLVLQEMQVLLAQLRTQLSILRAGMGVMAAAISIMFLLLTNPEVLQGGLSGLELPVKIILGLVAAGGLWRLVSAERKIRRIHHLIHKME